MIMEVHTIKELLETLKSLASKRRELSLISIRKFDSEYEQAIDRSVDLRDQHEDKALKPKDKETIGSLLDALDDAEECEVNLAYLAGLTDCLLILNRLNYFNCKMGCLIE